MKKILQYLLCVLLIVILAGCGHKAPKSKGIIAIDPGHQGHLNTATEPIGPGAKEKKAKVTAGATGVSTGNTEAEVVLEIGLKLRDALEAEGYEVVMTRESQDVDLSNKERAEIANEAHADAFIRLHLNSVSDRSVRGALCVVPTKKNPYLDKTIIKESATLSSSLLNKMCAATDLRNRGLSHSDKMSGINWCEVPVSIVEMGFISNPEEDELFSDEDFQDKVVEGLVNGVNDYMLDKEDD